MLNFFYKAIVNSEIKNAFIVIYPPSHYAKAEYAIDFCLFNNIPIAPKIR